jgi:hypothetical protein
LRCMSRRRGCRRSCRPWRRLRANSPDTSLCMIFRENALRVCRDGKPLHTFPDHALGSVRIGPA